MFSVSPPSPSCRPLLNIGIPAHSCETKEVKMTARVLLRERVYLNWNHPPPPAQKAPALSADCQEASRSFWDTISLRGWGSRRGGRGELTSNINDGAWREKKKVKAVRGSGLGRGEGPQEVKVFFRGRKMSALWRKGSAWQKNWEEGRKEGRGGVRQRRDGPLQCPWGVFPHGVGGRRGWP